MQLKSLLLHNFRNFSNFKISFSPHINVIYGDNAEGKTNILEAIYLISTGKSFRTQNLSDLIQENKKFFYVEAEIIKDTISQNIKIYYDGKNKKIEYNSKKYFSFSDLMGLFPMILYAPEDIELISSKPSIRRKLLNLHLAQKDPLYIHHLSRFVKANKQRNFLLKAKNKSTIKPWEIILSKSASYITHKRNEMITELNAELSFIIQNLTKKIKTFKLFYKSSMSMQKNILDTEAQFLKELDKNRNKEFIFGSTLIGPHKDDLLFLINDNIAKKFASEGQKKLLLFALRFTEWKILSKYNLAILGIDDYDAHLDENHKHMLKKYLNNFSQVFITQPKVDRSFKGEYLIHIKS